MNFVALLLGLGVERLLTQLFHLREFRWLDPLLDRGLGRLRTATGAPLTAGVAGLALAITAPVAMVAWLLGGAMLTVPYFAFAVLVLLFSLGPRDLKEEVDDYLRVVTEGDLDAGARIAKEILERDAAADPAERQREIERAIYVQANNRIFGVVFWFLVLGPAGAWLFRVLDLMRRRVAFRYTGNDADALESRVRAVHGAAAWLPARLLAAGYALAGSFEDALADWRGYYARCAPRFFDVSDDVLACTGRGAIGRNRDADGTEHAPGAGRIRAAMDLVGRTLWLIWCPVIAVLTLYNFLL